MNTDQFLVFDTDDTTIKPYKDFDLQKVKTRMADTKFEDDDNNE